MTITVDITENPDGGYEDGPSWTVSLRTPTAGFPLVRTLSQEQAHAEADRLALLTDDERSALIIASLVD